MGRYLVVTHQTASSPELLEKLKELASNDAEAEFVLLVPATPVPHLLSPSTEGEALDVARQAAEAAARLFQESGLTVVRVAVGDAVPVRAVQDDLREHPAKYEAIVVSTFPLGISRWLGVDVLHQMRRRFDMPVVHVVAEARASTSA